MSHLKTPITHRLRRVAVNYLFIDNERFVNQVIELDGSRMVRHYALEGEPAMTEWLGGRLEVVDGHVVSTTSINM